jgi:hypothetical protein
MTEEQIAAIAAMQAHLGREAGLTKDIDGIIEVGHAHYGKAGFDDAAQVVATAVGNTDPLMDTLRQFDRPHEIIAHLANNETQLKALAKLTPARQAVELARIEARMTSNGHVNTGADPLWKTPAVRTGRVSDVDWKTSYGEGLDDRRWNAEFDRREREKSRR